MSKKRAAPVPPGQKRLRSSGPLTLAALRRANPELDDLQGPRAHLAPIQGVAAFFEPNGWDAPVALLDNVVDCLAGAKQALPPAFERPLSTTTVPTTALQLYTLDSSPAMLAASLFAGFFVFGSEFNMPGRPLEERGLMNLELGGPGREPEGEDPGGRIVLDLTAGARRAASMAASGTPASTATTPRAGRSTGLRGRSGGCLRQGCRATVSVRSPRPRGSPLRRPSLRPRLAKGHSCWWRRGRRA